MAHNMLVDLIFVRTVNLPNLSLLLHLSPLRPNIDDFGHFRTDLVQFWTFLGRAVARAPISRFVRVVSVIVSFWRGFASNHWF